ncbi:MAG: hypothetical protein OHK0057_20030 [Thermoflexibacter sp.]
MLSISTKITTLFPTLLQPQLPSSFFAKKPISIEYNCIFIGLSFSVLYDNTQNIENQFTMYDVKNENLNFNPITYKPIRK